ncbi:MAG: 3-oxoacyl-ACP reductase FabG [Clostridiales bacterium]|nr:3-oxoacyl-ACP reductase FabG [Clostridiales bacterium]
MQEVQFSKGVDVVMNIVVTGASRGIGAKIAEKFAENGHNVVINYHTGKKTALELRDRLNKKGFKSIVCKATVTDRIEAGDLIDYCVRNFGSIDVLVNNAGIAQPKLFDQITRYDWEDMISVNLKGVFNCSQAAIGKMIRQKNGVIINISSIWGITGASMEVHYSATKAGVIGMTKALAKEVGPSNIRVNCVAPGVVRTDMLQGYTDEELNELKNKTALERLGTPEDIANAVYFLASDEASFITGEVLNVSGGFLI